MANTLELIKELRASLKNSRVVTPDSEDYAISIQRWSDVAVKKAVRLHDHDSFHVLPSALCAAVDANCQLY